MKSPALVTSVLLILMGAQFRESTATAQQQTTVSRPRTAVQQKPAAAQTQWMSISIVRVKPDLIDEWIDFVKNETIPALKKAGIKERTAWQTAQFGEAFEYIFITPVDSLAEYDGEPPIRKALGDQAYRAYLEKSRRMTISVRTYAVQSRPDLSHGRMEAPPKLAVVNEVQVAPGRSQDFETILKTEVLPAVRKAGVSGYLVSQQMFGGDANVFTTVTPYENFAEIGKGSPIQRAMGTAGYNRFLRRTAGVVTRVVRSIVRLNAELSIAAGLSETR